jgi:chromosome segregation ATPase
MFQKEESMKAEEWTHWLYFGDSPASFADVSDDDTREAIKRIIADLSAAEASLADREKDCKFEFGRAEKAEGKLENCKLDCESLQRCLRDAEEDVSELTAAVKENEPRIQALVKAARCVVRHLCITPGLDSEVDSVDMGYLCDALLPFGGKEVPRE